MAIEQAPARRRADGHPLITVSDVRYFTKLHFRLHKRLPMWVVYRPVTREYPGLWVARMHVMLPEARSTRFVMTHDTIGDLRELLPPGLCRLQRNTDDPQEIAEMWL